MRQQIEAAATRIAPHVRVTPVVTLRGEPDLGVEVAHIKLELLQHSGSFKARGAFNRMLSMTIPPAGVIAASGGNHGVAVALAARRWLWQHLRIAAESAGATGLAGLMSGRYACRRGREPASSCVAVTPTLPRFSIFTTVG